MEAQKAEPVDSLDELLASYPASVGSAAFIVYQGYAQTKLLACELALFVSTPYECRDELRYRGLKGLAYISIARHCAEQMLTTDVRRSLSVGYATRGQIPDVTLGGVHAHGYLLCVVRLLSASLQVPVDYLNSALSTYLDAKLPCYLDLSDQDDSTWIALRDELKKLTASEEYSYWSCVSRALDDLVGGASRSAVVAAMKNGGVHEASAAIRREMKAFCEGQVRAVVDGIGREIAYADILVKTPDRSIPFVPAPQDLAILDALTKEPCAVALEDIAAATGCGRKLVGERVKHLKDASLVASPPGMLRLSGITPEGREVVERWRSR